MDLAAIQETIYFVSGIGAAILGAYGTMKAQGKILYPVKRIEAGKKMIKELVEDNDRLGGVAEIINEVDAEELQAIIAKKKELDGIPGVTVEQKILILGTMFLNAMEKQ